MRRKRNYAWSVDLMKGKGVKDQVLGTFTSKAKALEAIDYWAPDGEYTPVNLKEQLCMNGLPSIVMIRKKNGRTEMLFVHRLCMNNGAALAHIKYNR